MFTFWAEAKPINAKVNKARIFVFIFYVYLVLEIIFAKVGYFLV